MTAIISVRSKPAFRATPSMSIRLYNSLTRRSEEFVPHDPERVTMYVCGPTVYGYIHIGNARPPVVFDVLARLLRRRYPILVYACNITDVDDKINAAAFEAGVPISTISDRYASAYRDDIAALGVAPADLEPHATRHIGEIIAMCQRLIDQDHAYAAEGHVLFDVGSYPDYGQLSRRSVDDMIAGARVEIAPYKRNPADFVLWKPSGPDLPGWESTWGRGRPGWHIECSAMAEAHLGDTIDIHGGGNDLMFPHHENEIAQSVCSHGGAPFARYWLHNGMLTMDGRKMSKSLGNVMLLHELLTLHKPEVLRFLLLKAHYRQPLEWSDNTLAQSQATLDGWYGVLRDLADVIVDEVPYNDAVDAAISDDINTPEALAVIAALANAARKASSLDEKREAKTALLGGGAALGLLQQDPEAWFQSTASGSDIDTAWIDDMIHARRAARTAKDFKRADDIRDELAARGVIIEDGAGATRWKLSDEKAGNNERLA